MPLRSSYLQESCFLLFFSTLSGIKKHRIKILSYYQQLSDTLPFLKIQVCMILCSPWNAPQLAWVKWSLECNISIMESFQENSGSFCPLIGLVESCIPQSLGLSLGLNVIHCDVKVRHHHLKSCDYSRIWVTVCSLSHRPHENKKWTLALAGTHNVFIFLRAKV